MLKVAFTENLLRKDGAAIPRVIHREIVGYEEILAFMAKGAVVSPADMKAVISQFTDAVTHYLANGKRVDTPLGSFSIHVRGHRGSPRTISPDSTHVRLRLANAVSEELRRTLQVSVVEAPPVPVPLLRSLTNADQKNLQNRGAVGDILQMAGARLSFDVNEATQGVFLIGENALETRALVYSRVGSRRIDFKIPVVATGAYTLEVRTQPGKSLRSGTYALSLTISEPV